MSRETRNRRDLNILALETGVMLPSPGNAGSHQMLKQAQNGFFPGASRRNQSC